MLCRVLCPKPSPRRQAALGLSLRMSPQSKMSLFMAPDRGPRMTPCSCSSCSHPLPGPPKKETLSIPTATAAGISATPNSSASTDLFVTSPRSLCFHQCLGENWEWLSLLSLGCRRLKPQVLSYYTNCVVTPTKCRDGCHRAQAA